MNSMEKSMLLDELFSLRKADKAEREQLLAKLDRMTEQLLSLNESSQAQTRMIDELKRMLSDRKAPEGECRLEGAEEALAAWPMRAPSSCMPTSRAVT